MYSKLIPPNDKQRCTTRENVSLFLHPPPERKRVSKRKRNDTFFQDTDSPNHLGIYILASCAYRKCHFESWGMDRVSVLVCFTKYAHANAHALRSILTLFDSHSTYKGKDGPTIFGIMLKFHQIPFMMSIPSRNQIRTDPSKKSPRWQRLTRNGITQPFDDFSKKVRTRNISKQSTLWYFICLERRFLTKFQKNGIRV